MRYRKGKRQRAEGKSKMPRPGNPELAIWNLKPGTWNLELGTWNLEL
jgi:hypothetical protein